MCHSYQQEQCQQRSPEDRGGMADGVFSDLSCDVWDQSRSEHHQSSPWTRGLGSLRRSSGQTALSHVILSVPDPRVPSDC